YNMIRYILLLVLLVSCSRKTTQTVSTDHTEQRETTALTVDQWQALAQMIYSSQLQTHAEAVTDHIVINANGDTVSRDITKHRSVSAKAERRDSNIKETSTAAQSEVRQNRTVDKARSHIQTVKTTRNIGHLIIGIVLAVIVIWAFLILYKVLVGRRGI
ncbi:MAG: hypothetical protein K2H75_06945, partial [Muribaculaceae bacterium]|nr:hypothetical protein [Muribaculaceae bacterium]